MSEWFDLCRGLRRIARHNSRCENGWLISFYSWHRGLSVWLCSLCSARGSHRLLAVTSLSPARRHGAHLSAGPGSSHPGHPAPKRHTGPAGGPRQCTGVTWPGLRPALQLLWPIGAGPCTRRAGTDRFIACQTAALQAAGPGWPGQTLVSLNHPQPRPDQLQSLRISAANTPGISAATLHTGATCHPSIVIDTHPRS